MTYGRELTDTLRGPNSTDETGTFNKLSGFAYVAVGNSRDKRNAANATPIICVRDFRKINLRPLQRINQSQRHCRLSCRPPTKAQLPPKKVLHPDSQSTHKTKNWQVWIDLEKTNEKYSVYRRFANYLSLLFCFFKYLFVYALNKPITTYMIYRIG